MRSILLQAEQIVQEHKKMLFLSFLFLSILELIQDLSGQMGIIGFLFILLFIAIRHAEVIMGLKVTGQKEGTLDPKQDGFYGIVNIKKLFKTYLLLEIIVTLMVFIGLTLLLVWLSGSQFDLFWDNTLQTILAEQKYGVSQTASTLFSYMLLAEIVLASISRLIIDYLFFAAPYLLETEGISGLNALRQAWSLSKGFRTQIFALQIHYHIPAVVFSCLDYLVMVYIQSNWLSSLVSIFLIIAAVWCYRMNYAVAKALLYQNIVTKKEVLNYGSLK